MIQSFDKPGMGGGASAPLPSGGIQGGSRPLQQNAQRMVPNPGQFNGNPRGAYNTNFMGQGNAPSYMQQTNLGRYTPPTMQDGGRYGFNSNQWNNSGGYNYNLPGSYGSPQGGGQFAPMPGQFQQYMQPNQLSGNTFGFGNPFGQGMQQGGGGMGGGSGQWGQQNWNAFSNSDAQQGGPGMGGQLDQMSQRYLQDYFSNPQPYQGGRGGGNGTPSYDEWRGGLITDMMMRSPEEHDAREADFRRMYEEQFGNQGGQQQGRGPMAPDKVGRPFPSRTNFRGRGSDEGGPAPMPAYDNPANRQYNMNALYQMMGGF